MESTLTEEYIRSLSQETLWLINQQRKILEEVLGKELLQDSKKDGKKRNLDQQEITQWIEDLDEYSLKVEHLEMNLALVGTMKAGKSTVINAIVGDEILPNRNSPMTTLPTIIRHNNSQQFPQMFLQKKEPIIIMLENMRSCLKKKKARKSSEQSNLIEECKDFIEECKTLTESVIYKDSNAIFEVLLKINDLFRFYTKLGQEDNSLLPIENYLMDYDGIDDFPVIETKFYHLNKLSFEHSIGTFSLLDTPGPNEAGQQKLKEVVNEQLGKASAVLAILDYSQLNAEADAEIRRELLDIVDYSEGRIFILVNKFDLKDHNSMNKEETKKYVSANLLQGKVPEGNIYPVSGRFAYLANRALREIEEKGVLPADNDNSWVEDFGNEAMGRRWENHINDVDEVKKAAEELWNDSFFNEPLESVISWAYTHSAPISIKAAIDKLCEHHNRLDQYLHNKSKMSMASFDSLKSAISELMEDIDNISCIKKQAEEYLKAMHKEIKAEINKAMPSNEEIQTEVNNFFNMHQPKPQKIKSEEETSFLKIIARFKGQKKEAIEELIDNGIAIFQEEEEAKQFIEYLTDQLNKNIFFPFFEQLQDNIEEKYTHIEKSINKDIKCQLEKIVDKASKRLKEEFDINITLPNIKVDDAKITIAKKPNKIIREEEIEKTGSYHERRWYTLWVFKHRVEYTYTETEYKIDKSSLSKHFQTVLKDGQKQYHQKLDSIINTEIRKSLDLFIQQLEDFLQRYHGDLSDSMKLKEQSKSKVEQSIIVIKKIRGKMAEQHDDNLQVREVLDNELA